MGVHPVVVMAHIDILFMDFLPKGLMVLLLHMDNFLKKGNIMDINKHRGKGYSSNNVQGFLQIFNKDLLLIMY